MTATPRIGRMARIAFVGIVAALCGRSDAGIPPGTGLVTIVSPAIPAGALVGVVNVQSGATQFTVHLEVAFGKDLAGAPADPTTFKPSLSGVSALTLLPMFTNVTDASGNITGKKADVTLPFTSLKKKYTFKAQVSSVLVNGKVTKGKAKVKFGLVTTSTPVIQNFRITNATGTTSSGNPVITVGQGANFQADLSSPDGELVTSYTLDPGDGNPPIAKQNPSGFTSLNEVWVYSAPGNFTATLTIKNASGQPASQPLALYANIVPTAALKINPTLATIKYPVTLDAIGSSDADGDSLTYKFDFGDGTAPVSGASNSVTHTYLKTGIFTVTLTATDAYGAASTAKSSLKIESGLVGTPMLQITSPLNGEVATVGSTLSVDVALGEASSGAPPDPTTFVAVLNYKSVASYFKTVTDPARNNAVVGMHGDIPVSMVHMNNLSNGLRCTIKSALFTTTSGSTRTILASQSIAFTATTGQPPTAGFTATPSEALVGQVITFDGSASKDPQGKPLTYAWDFGDGIKTSASSSPTTNHAYSAAGAYNVTLTVSDGAFNATATSGVVVRAVSTGNPTLAVSIPDPLSSGGTLDFGDLNGAMNITVAGTSSGVHESYPAWVEKCVEITNSGTGSLTVSSVATSNGSFQVRNASQVTGVSLAAGESYFIGVRFNPRPFTDPTDNPAWTPVTTPPPAPNGPQSDTLTITTNAGTQTVPLTGNVVSSLPAASIRLMRSDAFRIPKPQFPGEGPGSEWNINSLSAHAPGDGSVLDMGIVANSSTDFFGRIVNEGGSTGSVTGVTVLDDQGNASLDFSAQLVHQSNGFAKVEPAISMIPGTSLETVLLTGGAYQGDFVQITFKPTNTGGPQRLSAKLLLHTDSGVDQVVGLTGIGVDAPLYTFGGGDFEFSRTAPGANTTNLYQNSNVSPATVIVQNIGRQSGTVTASISGIDGGSAPAFTVSPASISLVPVPTQQGTFTLKFSPTAAGHYDGVLTIHTGLNFEPDQQYLLHGYAKGGVGILGIPGNAYSFDDTDFANTEMDSMSNAGSLSGFSQLTTLQDPFLVAGNTVDMSQFNNPDWSSLVMLAGHEYTIDGSNLGPYVLSNPSLNGVAKTRLASGPIYSGSIESHGGFVAGIDTHVDIQSDPTTNDVLPTGYFHNGVDPIRLDVTPDSILFYTAVSSNVSTWVGPVGNQVLTPSPVIVTSLRWENLSTHTGGVVTPDVASLLGVPNDEVLDMRVIKTSTGYRAFFIFDAQDASKNQVAGDMDLSSAFAVTAQKSLTGTLSDPSAGQNGNQPIIIDANGLWYTSATVQNPDGSSTMQVFRENLHASAGKSLFASLTNNFGDADAGEVLVDNQGTVILMTNDGLCAFSSAGVPMGYVLENTTYYGDNFLGGTSGSDTVDLSDFNAVWLDK